MNWLIALLLTFSLLSQDSIDINTASVRILETIPGIGPARASAIVEYRDLYGPFETLDELEFVDGIGSGTVDNLLDYIYIDPSEFSGIDTTHWLEERDSLAPEVRVCFLDVGQGDAILVSADSGRTLLFDGGPAGQGQLEPAVVFRLRSLGVDSIDILTFSHPHADHIGGLSAVLRNFHVGEILDPGMVFSSPVYEEFLQQAMESGCDYGFLLNGMEIWLSPTVCAEVLSPVPRGTSVDVNEASALLKVTCGNFSLLLTGDVEVDSEMLLSPGATPVTVLKVPHHGSASSLFPPYIRRLAPQVAVFSAGRGNRFGHPGPAVVDFYRELGSEILRTDTQGTIVVESDGEVLSISTHIEGYCPGDDIEDKN